MGKGKKQSRSRTPKKKNRSKSKEKQRSRSKERKQSKSKERDRKKVETGPGRSTGWGVASQPKTGNTDDFLRDMYNNPKTSATPQTAQALIVPQSHTMQTQMQYTFVPGMNPTILKMLNDPTKVRRKIKIPPDLSFNYIGLIIGPKGVSQKKLEEETGAKILVRGRGSQKPEQPPQPDDDEDLHVLVVAETPQQAANACDRIERILLADADELQRYRQEQMKLIAQSQQTPTTAQPIASTGSVDPSDLSMTTPYGPPSKDAYVYPVPNEFVGLVIGVKGETIQQLKEKSGCKNVQVAADSAPGSQTRNVFIVGDPDCVKKCQGLLQEIIDTQRKVRTAPGAKKIEFQVHDQFVALIIGKKGVTIKAISERSGAFVAITQSPDYQVRPDHKAFVLSGTEEQLNIAIREIETLLEGAKKAYFAKTCVDPSTINIPTPLLINPPNALANYQITNNEMAPQQTMPEFRTPEEQVAYQRQLQMQTMQMQYYMMIPAQQAVVEERVITKDNRQR
ncbi:unnamed protein product (macronuclear) [Paramecium tetraurelia]|uniref:K Homology domain-containing protein n=1 Tax=Paramecium tetraurelia TaxID=5888 RepID=A0CRV2_PARTE|nr:uncharacterized protein GSPATT00009834001 [Paramecium tetraurelia]CAK73519.1 unnamed protein product [Paramecium tetraurelia]|eukprot:XP_001440916.1 hypothetical protein (macronuclear) [Paramecium tetraurelia strain d4-2]